ncbi:MAG TPA: hypothetical protein PK375_08770 [Rhodocyclaceae bacterium]|nr:hypothetical protein [Rhodocyclaceae bacterium]
MNENTPARVAHCGHCRHFREHAPGTGACHRFPPVFAGDGSPNERHRWKHPLVPAHGGCGEFRPWPAPPVAGDDAA